MGVQQELRPHEGTVEFGMDAATRKCCVRIRCSCGWIGPDHDLEADTHEAVMVADAACHHDFRVHMGWRRLDVPMAWTDKLPR